MENYKHVIAILDQHKQLLSLYNLKPNSEVTLAYWDNLGACSPDMNKTLHTQVDSLLDSCLRLLGKPKTIQAAALEKIVDKRIKDAENQKTKPSYNNIIQDMISTHLDLDELNEVHMILLNDVNTLIDNMYAIPPKYIVHILTVCVMRDLLRFKRMPLDPKKLKHFKYFYKYFGPLVLESHQPSLKEKKTNKAK